jgi:hypothetical protein
MIHSSANVSRVVAATPCGLPHRLAMPVRCYAFLIGWLLLSQPPGVHRYYGGRPFAAPSRAALDGARARCAMMRRYGPSRPSRCRPSGHPTRNLGDDRAKRVCLSYRLSSFGDRTQPSRVLRLALYPVYSSRHSPCCWSAACLRSRCVISECDDEYCRDVFRVLPLHHTGIDGAGAGNRTRSSTLIGCSPYGHSSHS